MGQVGEFFVERTLLEWGADQQHVVSLRSLLKDSSVIFVRLIQEMLENAAFPIAYQATPVSERDERGYTRVKLEQMRPKHAEPLESAVEEAHDVRFHVA